MDNKKPFIHGKVILVSNRPNSFMIKLSSGQTVERNRKHLIWDPGYDNSESSENEVILKMRQRIKRLSKVKRKHVKENKVRVEG